MLQRIISHEHFKELLAYDRLQPHVDDMLPVYFANLTRVLAEVNRDDKQRALPYTMQDFLWPFRGAPAARQDDVEAALDSMFRGLTGYHNGDNSESGS